MVGGIHEERSDPLNLTIKDNYPIPKNWREFVPKKWRERVLVRLRFDDTTGQISTQLQSSHGASQLNLGKLSHPKDKAKVKIGVKVLSCRLINGGQYELDKVYWCRPINRIRPMVNMLDAEIARTHWKTSHSNSKVLK